MRVRKIQWKCSFRSEKWKKMNKNEENIEIQFLREINHNFLNKKYRNSGPKGRFSSFNQNTVYSENSVWQQMWVFEKQCSKPCSKYLNANSWNSFRIIKTAKDLIKNSGNSWRRLNVTLYEQPADLNIMAQLIKGGDRKGLGLYLKKGGWPLMVT